MNSYYNNLPRKRMGAGALFFNKDNELLIVKPSYKDYWSIPGGTVDQDESPRHACAREIKEEIDLNIDILRFLAVDYNSRENEEKNESLQFIFYGGILSDESISKIKIDGKELLEYRFVPISEVRNLLGQKLATRLQKCIDAIKTGTSVYLENGEF